MDRLEQDQATLVKCPFRYHIDAISPVCWISARREVIHLDYCVASLIDIGQLLRGCISLIKEST